MATDRPLHEFVPVQPVPPNHICRGHCYCAVCAEPLSMRSVHYQRRDARRPKEGSKVTT